MRVQSLGQEDLLEEEMATHFINLSWKISWAEESGGLQSIRLQSQAQLSTHTFSSGLLAFSEAGLEEMGLTRHWVCLKARKT